MNGQKKVCRSSTTWHKFSMAGKPKKCNLPKIVKILYSKTGMPKSVKIIEMLGRITLVFSLATTPLFFLPLTADFYDTGKWLLLVVTGSLVLALWAARAFVTKTFTFSTSPAGVAFAGLTLAVITSLVLASTNKVEGVLAPYGLAAFAAATIFLHLGPTMLGKTGQRQLFWALILGSALAGLVAVYQFFGLGKTLFPNTFLTDPLWTPVGSSVALSTFLILVLPLAAGGATHEFHKKKEIGAIVGFIAVAVIVAGLAATLVNLVPKLPTALFPIPASWAVLLEAFKVPGQALFGVGAENFLSAATAGRPIGLNAGAFWNVRFTVGSSWAFQLATTLGLLGLVGLLMLVRGLVRAIAGSSAGLLGWGARLSLFLGLLAWFLVPPNLTLLITLVALLIISQETSERQFAVKSKWLRSGLAAGILVVAAVTLAAAGRSYAAETAFYRSILASQKNNGSETYNQQVEAIRLNPQVTRFHIGLSQTSLALANVIVGSSITASPAGSLSDQDRQMVTQLLQQTINEAKVSTTLAPKSVLVWENLASVYESIMKVAQGADQWAIAAYQQAIALDPTNPILRLRLGGVFVGLGRLDEAAYQYQLATILKPDYANAHYNLAFIYRRQNNFLKAALALAATKLLVLPGSDDEQKLAAELSEVRGQLTPEELKLLDSQTPPGAARAGSANIISPISSPETELSPKLSLPSEASPTTR